MSNRTKTSSAQQSQLSVIDQFRTSIKHSPEAKELLKTLPGVMELCDSLLEQFSPEDRENCLDDITSLLKLNIRQGYFMLLSAIG